MEVSYPWVDWLWLVGIVVAVDAAVFLFVWTKQSQPMFLIVAVSNAMLAGTIFVLDQWLISPREQVERALTEIVSAFERGDAETIKRAVHPDYSDGQRNADGVREIIDRRSNEADIDEVVLRGLEFDSVDSDMVASFVAQLRGRYGGSSAGQSYPVRLKIRFRRNDSNWQMIQVRRFDPIRSGVEIPLDRVP